MVVTLMPGQLSQAFAGQQRQISAARQVPTTTANSRCLSTLLPFVSTSGSLPVAITVVVTRPTSAVEE